jgi:hypothetical protein
MWGDITNANVEKVYYYLENGCDPNASDEWGEHTLLTYAMHTCNRYNHYVQKTKYEQAKQIIRLLLKFGANANASTFGKPLPVQLAVDYDDPDMLSLLLDDENVAKLIPSMKLRHYTWKGYWGDVYSLRDYINFGGLARRKALINVIDEAMDRINYRRGVDIKKIFHHTPLNQDTIRRIAEMDTGRKTTSTLSPSVVREYEDYGIPPPSKRRR